MPSIQSGGDSFAIKANRAAGVVIGRNRESDAVRRDVRIEDRDDRDAQLLGLVDRPGDSVRLDHRSGPRIRHQTTSPENRSEFAYLAHHIWCRDRYVEVDPAAQNLLDQIVAAWQQPSADTPLGLILAMESADPILGPDQVPEWYELGLRMVSISHYGTSTYSYGTGTQGGLLPPAKPLLDAFAQVGIIVDMTHLTDEAHWELLDIYDGPICASHHNCRALTPGQRQLTDEMIRSIAARGGVIGTALDAWMLDPNWQKKVPPYAQQTQATMETVADHIDYIAQLLGTARHCGIGTDLDGGFGAEQAPRDLNTIADLQKLHPIFTRRGYSDEDILGIFSANWIGFLKEVWSN